MRIIFSDKNMVMLNNNNDYYYTKQYFLFRTHQTHFGLFLFKDFKSS